MALTLAQQQALKADILADPALAAHPNNGDGNTAIQAAYLVVGPSNTHTVFRTLVMLAEVGDAFNGTEFEGNLTGLELDRLRTIADYSTNGINPSRSDRRTLFANVWAGCPTTLAALDTLWRRLANRGERLFASGTGSVASPATLTFEGQISLNDIQEARNLP